MKALFKKLTNENPLTSSLVVFNMAVRTGGFDNMVVDRLFNQLVDKKDYARKDKEAILEHSRSLCK